LKQYGSNGLNTEGCLQAESFSILVEFMMRVIVRERVQVFRDLTTEKELRMERVLANIMGNRVKSRRWCGGDFEIVQSKILEANTHW